MDYRYQHKVIVEKMIQHERKKGHKVEEVFEDKTWRLLYFRVDDRSIRVFCSGHTGGIMVEDGVAIPQTVFYGVKDKGLSYEPKPFIRVVAIQEKKFKDYALSEFNWRPREETRTMNAKLSIKQKEELLYSGEEFTDC